MGFVLDANKNEPFNELFKTVESQYGDKYKDHLLEQYKLYVEMADKVSERRATANNFFLSVNGFLLSVLGVLPHLQSNLEKFSMVWIPVVAIGGIIFCVAWVRVICTHKKLNEAKFAVINAIEQRLPATVYDTEWKYLNPNEKKRKYLPLTIVETWVPWTFIVLYGSLMIVGLYITIIGLV